MFFSNWFNFFLFKNYSILSTELMDKHVSSLNSDKDLKIFFHLAAKLVLLFRMVYVSVLYNWKKISFDSNLIVFK